MAKKNNNMIWIIVAIAAIVLFTQVGKDQIQLPTFLGALTGDEIISRSAPSLRVDQSSSFLMTYTASGGTVGTGPWAVTVEDLDTASMCLFPAGGSLYQTFLISDDSDTKVVSVITPATKTNCVFVGDYKFGADPIEAITPGLTVEICTMSCTRPGDLCVQGSDVVSGCTTEPDCSGAWTVTQATVVDVDCSNIVDRTELGAGLTDWLAATITRNTVGLAIQSWIDNA